MSDFDRRLSEALGEHDPEGERGGVTPSDGALEGIRTRGGRRRRRKIATMSATGAVVVFAAGSAIIARDGTGTIQTTSISPPSAPTSPSASVVEFTAPASSVPATVPVSTVESTLPATTGPVATAPPTTPPTTPTPPTTTVPAATVPAATVPSDGLTVPFSAVVNAPPVTTAILETSSFSVSGTWPEASAERSMLVRQERPGSSLVVLADGVEVVRATMECLPDAPVCATSPPGWVIGTSLWAVVDDVGQTVVFEVDLLTGTMTERLRGLGGIHDMVGSGDEVRFIATADELPGMVVAAYRDGRVTGLVDHADARAMEFDRSGTRLFLALSPNQSAMDVPYEVLDPATGAVERAGAVSADAVYVDVAEFSGSRVVLGDSLLASGSLLDLDTGSVVYGGSGPGCLLDDGTAIFESRREDDGVTAGPLVVVGVDGGVVETPTIGTGHNDGETRCGADHVIIRTGEGTVVRMEPDGSSVDTGMRLPGVRLIQVGGRAVGNR